MLYYVSMADDDDGHFLGAVFVNAESEKAAGKEAARIEGKTDHIQMLTLPVPGGGPAIPAIGKLLSRVELEAWSPQQSVWADDDGSIHRDD
jgi:hypothetical protein